jgi:hypothetical protein
MAEPARARARVVAARRTIESRLLWIFGSPRSGSSWLLHLLEDHPRAVPVDEPLIGSYLSPFLIDAPGWRPESLDTASFTIRRVQLDKRDQFLAREFEDVWRPALAKLMLDRFFAHSMRYPARARLGRTLVAIKEPNGSQSADVIMEALPQSRMLFLLRDGRDVVDSDLAANQKGSWVSRQFPGESGIDAASRLEFVKQSAQKWLWRTEVVQQAYSNHPGPKHQVRYEDLRASPIENVRAIYDWLGLELDDQGLAELVERHAFEQIPESERGPLAFARAAKPGLWRENLTESEQEALGRLLGPKLEDLGYER